MARADAIAGAILGCAVGDALGLPYEGLAKQRGVRLLGPPDQHRFLFGRGMVSDDTEHACMVAQALCTSPGDPAIFAKNLAWRLRWWLLGVPAGIGLATLQAWLRHPRDFRAAIDTVVRCGGDTHTPAAMLGRLSVAPSAAVEFRRTGSMESGIGLVV